MRVKSDSARRIFVPIIAAILFAGFMIFYFYTTELSSPRGFSLSGISVEAEKNPSLVVPAWQMAEWSGLSIETVESVLSYDQQKDRLTVNSDGFLAWNDTGERFFIVEANSPENRLRYLEYDQVGLDKKPTRVGNPISPDAALQQLVELRSYGVNTIYFTIFGGDDEIIFLSPENFDLYRSYCLYASDLGMILHVVLGEQENHHLLSRDERSRLFTRAMLMVYGLPAILCLGEEITQQRNGVTVGYNYVREWCTFLRDRGVNIYGHAPIVSVHNELHWRPWDRFAGEGLIHLIAFQGNMQQGMNETVYWHNVGLETSVPWAIYNSEISESYRSGLPVSRVGFPSDAAGGEWYGMRWTWGNWRASSGVGIYGGYQDMDYIREYPNHIVRPGEEVYNDGYGDLFAPDVSVHRNLFRSIAASAGPIINGGGPVSAQIIGVQVPYEGQAIGSRDKNNDGIYDAADTLF